MFFSSKINKIRKIKESWGKPKNEKFNFDLIEHYFRNRDNSAAFQVISDRIINDIDFYQLFKFVDRTNSKIGQQYLFNELLTIHGIPHLNENEEKADFFLKNEDKRMECQLLLSNLDKLETYYISSLFLGKYIKPPKWLILVKLLSVTSLSVFIISFFIPKFVLLLIFLLLINLTVHYQNKDYIFKYTDSIPQLLTLCKNAKELLKKDIPSESDDSVLSSIKSIEKLKYQMSVFTVEARSNSDFTAIGWIILEYIKILFLLELLIVFNVLKKLEEKKLDIQNIFEYVGKIDSIISIMSFRSGLEYYCKPSITNNPKQLEFTDMHHPLIKNCIPNSLKIKDKSILLTGSNMSGKTTFIRTLAINVLFAQTINTCFAKEFTAPLMRILSAIRITDDLFNDKSYYLEEVLTVKEFIKRSKSKEGNLFLLDELFKGTNTTERISAGKAVLSYLSYPLPISKS